MRLLTTGIAALAVSTFALAPAHACSWGKTAKSKDMTVAETIVAPEIDTDISIATNDLSDQVLQEMTVPEVETEEPAE